MNTNAMFRRLMLGAVMVVSGAAISDVSAQFTPIPSKPPVANPTPSAGSIALAKELLALKGGNEMFGGMVSGVIEQAKNSFLPNNPSLSRPLAEVAAQLQKDFEPKKAELINDVARAYARYFTETELKELLAFYKTALGKKVLTAESAAVEDGFGKAQEWTNGFSDQVLSRFRAEMKKKGYDL
ncbi:MAG: DUF2059 domain-containing protein [Xanthobacteraceae bacterium]